MAQRINISIMPTINGRRRADLHALPTVGPDMPDAEVGEVLGDYLRSLQDVDIHVGADSIELELRIY